MVNMSRVWIDPATNTTYELEHDPELKPGGTGVASSTFVDNAQYREELFTKLKAEVVDMEVRYTTMSSRCGPVMWRVAFVAWSKHPTSNNALNVTRTSQGILLSLLHCFYASILNPHWFPIPSPQL